MQERLMEIPKKLLEYWNKWTTKQKTIIISVVSAVIIMIAILVWILGRTKYTELYQYDNTATASNVISLLKESDIATRLGSDNLTVMVDEKKYADAIMAVSVSDLVDDGFGIDDMLNNSLTTTNGERLLKIHLRQENKMEKMIKDYCEGILDVNINYIPKDTSNSILTSSKSIPVSIMLVTNNQFEEENAIAIAKMVAFGIGNEDTDLVKIVDQKGNVLYDGPEIVDETKIDLTDKMAMSEYLHDKYIEEVTGAMLMNGFSEVNVAPYLAINYDKITELFTEYIPLEGETSGVLTEEHETASSGVNNTGDIPGTDSNDEVDYYIQEGQGGEYETSTMDRFYEPSVRVTNKVYDQGTVSAEESSISVTATRVIQRTEEELELLGLLDDMSFDEYVLRNSDPVRTDEIAGDLVRVVSTATGIPEENITVRTYDIYKYTPRVEVARDWSFYLQILLTVFLIGFLLFVIFRGTAPVEVTELEPELSVEQLLATTKENQSLEDVEFSEQSETRKMIEKFFDENPEAVAALLRNWLNEDWE